ncbi:cation:H+ antiporter [Fibrobacter sp. UWB15]|jgi:cation:H+ antiporter|uniref:calcium/sodium antiporter n=1 Tax=unclassified Fibrobacter TaxID=2634177 RepID=UPI000910DE5D|nr:MULTISPECIES: calcium/sodium antiporter [unclassified Fibrobacter]PWJ67802.1 cation:H+ antiporter [Fibrobacter sp. UWB6]SHF78563.1 cation:H+ antiporter [Fibrobacter sp. UWB8]SMG15292.1 cation:H+ antiporter [Fibrobacter sp. UWB15]
MILAIVAVILGLAVLVWSADKFVDGAVGIAEFCGMSTLLIGMVIVGFGTSAPELTVSAISASQGNPALALGNAYGSNIANIALILGATALISPILMQRSVIRGDLPILIAVSLLSIALVWDGSVVRWNGVLLLVVFALVMAYSIWRELKKARVEASNSVEEESAGKQTSLGKSIFWLVLGLALLVASSRALVWGAVEIARTLGVSDLLIGLTIVAIGTSLPELASSIAAARKGENDLALGNIIGSNLFNTLAVVGLAATISPMDEIEKAVTYRDMPLMTALTVALIVLGFRRKGEGRLNRIAGAILLAVYVGYLALLIAQAKG